MKPEDVDALVESIQIECHQEINRQKSSAFWNGFVFGAAVCFLVIIIVRGMAMG